MQLAHCADRQPDVEDRARGHVVVRSATSGASAASCVGDLADGEDRRVGGAQVLGMQVVGVDVGDQHRGRAVHRLGFGEDARVEDDDVALVLDPDAGVAELGDPHVA